MSIWLVQYPAGIVPTLAFRPRASGFARSLRTMRSGRICDGLQRRAIAASRDRVESARPVSRASPCDRRPPRPLFDAVVCGRYSANPESLPYAAPFGQTSALLAMEEKSRRGGRLRSASDSAMLRQRTHRVVVAPGLLAPARARDHLALLRLSRTRFAKLLTRRSLAHRWIDGSASRDSDTWRPPRRGGGTTVPLRTHARELMPF